MNKIQELRKDVDKLENTVKEAVEKFMQETGECDIKISVDTSFWINGLGEKRMVESGVKVRVTV